ncbi:IclR family transcriptional regulator [Actinomadura fulvescens]|uniref:IclR family transcriptional regulator n=1 Tax=Actinomadura fulvescens TaxID=46160 RepID=A0ABP6CIF0_9ACTN
MGEGPALYCSGVRKDGGPRPAYPIASVDNALRLLTLFRENEKVRLSEAREFLGVAHSTAHRLLAMLAYHGFVRQEPDSRVYVAGPMLVEIGLSAVRNMDIRLHARPLLEDLATWAGETVHLVALEGAMVRYLDAVESARSLRVAARIGTTLAAHCTASGKAMLAALPEAEVAALLPAGRPLPAETGHSITDTAGLMAELARVRERGHAVNREESEDGVASVAVAVLGPRGRPVAALAISAPVSRLPGERAGELAARLGDEAERLARLVGFGTAA